MHYGGFVAKVSHAVAILVEWKLARNDEKLMNKNLFFNHYEAITCKVLALNLFGVQTDNVHEINADKETGGPKLWYVPV